MDTVTDREERLSLIAIGQGTLNSALLDVFAQGYALLFPPRIRKGEAALAL